MRPSGPRFTIRQLAIVIAVVALGLAVVREAFRFQVVAILFVWVLSPLLLTPVFRFLPPALMRRLFRTVAIIAFAIMVPCTYVVVSGGPFHRAGAVALWCLWLAMAFAYGHIASVLRALRMKNEPRG